MLIRRAERGARRGTLLGAFGAEPGRIDRRAFLRRSGLAAGALAALGTLPVSGIRNAEAGPPPKLGIPAEGARGGAETLYPEFRARLKGAQ